MVPQHCNLHVSWKTQLVSGLFYSGVIIVILLMPWPLQNWSLWLVLVLLIMVEAILAQRRITQLKGEFALLSKDAVFWSGERWLVKRAFGIPQFGVLLLLTSESMNKNQRLWIAADSLSEHEWRNLKYELLN